MSAKILLIGWDSADAGLIESWCDSGELPNLQNLRTNGNCGDLSSPSSMADDAAWASFSTAVSPAQNGRYSNQALLPGSYETPWFQDRHWKSVPFWDASNLPGKRIAVVDVPKSPLAKNINGVQLKDWLVHGRDGSTVSVPERLAADLIQRYGDDMTDRTAGGEWLCSLDAIDPSRQNLLLQRLLKSVENKKSALLELLNQETWDLFLGVFKESHCAGHQLWTRQSGSRNGNQALKKVYQSLDTALGELVAQSGEGTNTIVFSGLGMNDNFSGEHLLDDVLRRIEKKRLPWIQNTFISADIFYHKAMGHLFRSRVKSSPHRNRLVFQLEHNEISGAVRLNLKGREPHGQVDPEDYRSFCADLAAELKQLKDPVSKLPLVEEVIHCKDAFSGQHQDCLPDVLVRWTRKAPINGAGSESLGSMMRTERRYRPGNHVEGGFYVASGPQFNQNPNESGGSIMDIAPTVAKLMGLELRNVEGRPLDCIKL